MPEELFPPEDLRRALHSQFREVRLGAVRELSGPGWLHHQDPVRAGAARRQLEWRAGLEDDQAVKTAIRGQLGGPAGSGRAGGKADRGRRRRDRSLVGIGVVCGACVATLAFGALAAARPPVSQAKPAPSPAPAKPTPAHAAPARHVGPPPAGPGGAPLAVPDGQSVRAVAFSPDGGSLAVGASSGTTYRWDMTSRQVTGRLADTATQGAGSPLGVAAVAYSPDGTAVAAADQNGYVYVWDSRDQPAFAPLHDNGARSVAFSADGRYLATGDGNGDIYLWSAASGACLAYARDPGGQPSVTAVAFSPGSAVLAAGDAGGAYLWDTAGLAAAGAAAPGCQGNPADLEPAALTVPDGQKVTAVAFSPDGQDVATGDADGNTYLWTTGLRTTGLRTTGLRTTGRHQIARTVTDQGSGGVSAVAFSANGAVLATGDSNGSTYLWYAATGAAIGALPSPGSRDGAPAQDTAGAGDTPPAQDTGGTQGSAGVTAVAFRPGSPVGTLAVGDADGSTYLWPMAWLGY